MFKKSIRKSVMAAVDQMIDRVQEAYDAEIERIDREAEEAKMMAHDNAVATIVSKFQ